MDFLKAAAVRNRGRNLLLDLRAPAVLALTAAAGGAMLCRARLPAQSGLRRNTRSPGCAPRVRAGGEAAPRLRDAAQALTLNSTLG